MRHLPHITVRALLALALLPCLARADIVHYKDGRTLEGTITARTATEITLKTDFGSIVVPLSKVARIEEKRTPAQEFEARRKALPAGDVAALFELAVWARDANLLTESRTLMAEVIALDPGHSLANESLGRVKVDGRWLDPAAIDDYVKQHEAERLAAGQLWEGESWQPEAEVMGRRGFVRVHGEWVERRSGETTLLLDDLATLGIVLAATSGTHITLFSDLPAETAETLVSQLDDVVTDLMLRWPPNDAERAALTNFDIPVLALPEADAVAAVMDSDVLVRYGASAAFRQRFRAARGFSLYWPRPLIGLQARAEQFQLAGDADLGRLGSVTHQLAHVLVQRFKNGRRTPGWVEAGLAAFYQGAVTNFASITITSYARGAGNEALDPWVKHWEDHLRWHENLLKPELLEQFGRLAPLMAQSVEQMDSREIGLSWSVLRFLMEQHPAELLAYLRAYDTGPDAPGQQPPLLHAAAWSAAFGDDIEQVERAWHTWVAQQPVFLVPPRLLSRVK